MESKFQKELKRLLQEGKFLSFDSFIIREMGYSLPQNLSDTKTEQEIRHKAFLEFRKRTDKQNFATMPTMRRWFGIGSYSRPSRENVYRICFALGADKEKTEQYLTEGLGEPSFQINDYYEIIYLFGLENGLSYEECIQMARVFEESLDRDVSFQKTHTTRELFSQYQASRTYSKEEFLLWMADRSDWFKGYSRTTLDYLARIRSNIISGIRREATEQLEILLDGAGFENWKKRHPLVQKEKDLRKVIRRFVNSYKKNKYYEVAEDIGESILELSQIAYGEKEANSKLLSEVYAVENTKAGSENIRVMSGKYLSDLFNVPTMKEQAIRTGQVLRALNELSDTAACPEWIVKLGEDYTHGKGNFSTVASAKKEFENFAKEHKRRCLLIQRGDILPMLLHLSQQQYLEVHGDDYEAKEAKKLFCDLANSTLNACNMAVLSEDYQLDVALLATFQEEEMYSYSDILDVLSLQEEELYE